MVGHQVLVLGIGVRVPTPQQPSVERGSTEVSRPNVQTRAEFLNRAGSVRGAYEKL